MGYEMIQMIYRYQILPSSSANSKEDFVITVNMEDRKSSEFQVPIRQSMRYNIPEDWNLNTWK